MHRRIALFILFAAILLITPFAVSSSLRDTGSRVVGPFTAYFQQHRIAVQNFFSSLWSIGTLRNDKEALEMEVVALQQAVSDNELLKRENAALRQELGVTGTERELPKIFARVILQGNDAIDRTFVVDVGSEQGVREGQPAVAQGYLVGRVIEVRARSARVRSILSPKSVVQAWLPTVGDKGVLIGEGNTVTLQKISQGFTVPEGALIETSGLRSASAQDTLPLPAGLLIGKTGPSLSKASDLTQNFRVDLINDSTSLESVMILLTDAP